MNWIWSGRFDEAAHILGFVLFDASQCHGKHGHVGHPHAQVHFSQPADGVLFEPEADIQTAIDSFNCRAPFVEIPPLVTVTGYRTEDSAILFNGYTHA